MFSGDSRSSISSWSIIKGAFDIMLLYFLISIFSVPYILRSDLCEAVTVPDKLSAVPPDESTTSYSLMLPLSRDLLFVYE